MTTDGLMRHPTWQVRETVHRVYSAIQTTAAWLEEEGEEGEQREEGEEGEEGETTLPRLLSLSGTTPSALHLSPSSSPKLRTTKRSSSSLQRSNRPTAKKTPRAQDLAFPNSRPCSYTLPVVLASALEKRGAGGTERSFVLDLSAGG